MASRKDVYTDEQRAEICAHILVNVAAGRPVTTIIEQDEGLCSHATFWRWYFADEELREKVTHAREHGVEAMMENARHVAATPMMGQEITERMVTNADGEMVPAREVKISDMLGHRRLLVDTLFKSAQMLKPKTYSNKLDVTSKGEKIGSLDALRAAEERDRALTQRREAGEE